MAINYKVIARQKPGTTSPEDLKYYAQLVRTQQVQERDIADIIADRCTVKAPDVRGVLTALEDEFVRQLQAGNIIQLGELGIFRPGVSGRAADTPAELSLINIKKVHVVFTPRDLLIVDQAQEDVSFKSVEGAAPIEV